MTPWLLALHLLGVVLWTGGLLAASVVLAQSARAEADTRPAVAQPARKLMRVAADPGAALAILAGVWLISSDFAGYFGRHWFQMKLALVVALVALHGMLAVRAKRAAAGAELQPREGWLLFAAVLAASALILVATLPGRMTW